MEAPAQLVIDAAIGHMLQGYFDDLKFGLRGFGTDLTSKAMLVDTQEKFQGHGVGEFGRIAETTIYRAEFSGKFATGITQHLKRHGTCGINAALVAKRGVAELLEVIGTLCRLLLHLFPMVPVVISYGQQDTRKPWHRLPPILTVTRREICTSVERTAIGREKNGHGPAALLCHGLYCLHIDVVYVGSFFAIYLDRGKMMVHNRCYICGFKGFALHDVAPVAGGVADAEQDWFFLPLFFF